MLVNYSQAATTRVMLHRTKNKQIDDKLTLSTMFFFVFVIYQLEAAAGAPVYQRGTSSKFKSLLLLLL